MCFVAFSLFVLQIGIAALVLRNYYINALTIYSRFLHKSATYTPQSKVSTYYKAYNRPIYLQI